MADRPAPLLPWTRDVSPATWLPARLGPWGRNVGSVVPSGYEAYGRLFHPLDGRSSDEPKRWSDLARRNGRIVHPEMQLHALSGPDPSPDASWGSLPLPERRVLVEALRPHTATPDRCWFCVWDGWGQIDDEGVTERVELPARTYLLSAGPIEGALAPTNLHGIDQSPNLWWPEDRAWFVCTEVDYAWTYVAGSGRAIADLLADPRLEVLAAQLTDSPFHDGDRRNGAPAP